MSKIKNVIKQMFYILNRPQKILCMMVFGATCIGSLLECLGVSVIIPVVNVILDPDKVKNSVIFQKYSFLKELTNN